MNMSENCVSNAAGKYAYILLVSSKPVLLNALKYMSIYILGLLSMASAYSAQSKQ